MSNHNQRPTTEARSRKLEATRWRIPLPLLALLASSLALLPRPAHALSITSVSFSNTNIPFQSGGVPTGATISLTLDGPADVTITVHKVTSGADSLSSANLKTTLSFPSQTTGNKNFFWNGNWLIDGESARENGNFRFNISASTPTATTATSAPSTLVTITSVDIHSITVSSGIPSSIGYKLARDALVTIRIRSSNNTVVRTLVNRLPRSGEGSDTSVTNTDTWDGLDDSGNSVPLGVYTIELDATNPTSGDTATTRSRTVSIQQVANPLKGPQEIFRDSAFNFPNPVRGGQTTFQFQAVRNARVTLRIYTINGDLVREQVFDGVTAGSTTQFTWDTKNQAGQAVGRGLYFWVLRSEDAAGVLQTVKKLAVIK